MLNPDFAMGALIGMMLWRIIWCFTGGYQEQNVYKAGYDKGMGEGEQEGRWAGYHEGYRHATQEMQDKIRQCVNRM